MFSKSNCKIYRHRWLETEAQISINLCMYIDRDMQWCLLDRQNTIKKLVQGAGQVAQQVRAPSRSRGLGFESQHLYGTSQPSPVPRDLASSSGLQWHIDIYMQANIHTHKTKVKEKRIRLVPVLLVFSAWRKTIIIYTYLIYTKPYQGEE